MTKYFKVYLNTNEDGSPCECDFDGEGDNIQFISRELAEEFCMLYNLNVNHIVESEDSYMIDFYRPKPDKFIFTGQYSYPTGEFNRLRLEPSIEGEVPVSQPNATVFYFNENTFRLIPERTHLSTYVDTGIRRMEFTVEASSEDDAMQIVRDYVNLNGMVSNLAGIEYINKYYK